MSADLTLEEVVAGLDPDVEAHWTKTGLPNLNAVKEILGRAVSRKDIDDKGLADWTQGKAADAKRKAKEEAEATVQTSSPVHEVTPGPVEPEPLERTPLKDAVDIVIAAGVPGSEVELREAASYLKLWRAKHA